MNQDLSFGEKIRLIYGELKGRSDRRGVLEEILDGLEIAYTDTDLFDFRDFIVDDDHARVFDNKTRCEITLKQSGLDYLRQPKHQETPTQNIIIENYQGSIVAKGDNISQSGSFEFGIKNDSSTAVNNPNEKPSPKPNSKSPTKTWQIIGVGVAIISAAFVILKHFNLI